MQELYSKMTQPQRIIAALVIVVAFGAALYYAYLTPELEELRNLKGNVSRTEKIIASQTLKIAKLRNPGRINKDLPLEKMEAMAKYGNETLFASEIPLFLETLERIVEKSGGDDVRIEEGEISLAYIKDGKNNSYKIKKLPFLLVFDSSYAAASNFLFQAKAMKRMLKLSRVELRSEDLTGKIKVMVDMELFFTEES